MNRCIVESLVPASAARRNKRESSAAALETLYFIIKNEMCAFLRAARRYDSAGCHGRFSGRVDPSPGRRGTGKCSERQQPDSKGSSFGERQGREKFRSKECD